MQNSERPTVIIAEELALVRDGIAAVCEFSGRYRVVGCCADGEAAWRLIEQHHPDFAIVDLAVPLLYALELANRVRQAGLRTRLVVISLRKDRKTVLEVLRCGAQAFILLSSPARQLLDGLEQIAEGGVYVSPDIDIQTLFAPEKGKHRADPLGHLSAREYQVFSLLVEGIRAKEIAARLNLSPKTVDTYRASLMRKLDIHDVAGLVKFALQQHLIPPD